MSKKNVLIIISDDWSPIAGCYEDPVIQTPRIDEFARSGVVFEQAFCTAPTCAVSRACLLTGVHSHTHGQYGHSHAYHGFRTHEWIPSIPKLLKDAGYTTGLIGKEHFGPAHVYPFDYKPPVDHRSATDTARKTKAFLDTWKDEPFFLMVASTLPHRTKDDTFHTGIEHEGTPDVQYDPDTVPVPGFLPDNEATRQDLADYYNAISRMDQQYGAVLDALEASGRAKDTLVFMMSDHGMPFPGAKASSYDSGQHCPLIVRDPGGRGAGQRNHALVNWTDVSASVLDWCGVAYPEGGLSELAGRSFLPILNDDSPTPGEGAWEATFFSHCFHEIINYYPWRVLRERRFKLVHNLAPELPLPIPTDLFRSPTWAAVREGKLQAIGHRSREAMINQPGELLYDLEQDPMETTNLAEDPAYADQLASMRKQLMDFRVKTRDPWTELDFQKGVEGAQPFTSLI